MPTFANFATEAFRSGMREAQDVLAAHADVDVVPLRARGAVAASLDRLAVLAHHDFTGRIARMNPGIEPVRLDRRYDLFVLVCPWWRDVWYVNAIENWQDSAAVKVCWIDELWVSELDGLRRWLPVLRDFDYVFVGIDGTGPPLADRLARPCFDLAGAVDVVRFAPGPARVIDVLSVGRRPPPAHEALVRLAAERQLYYVYDTLQSGDSLAPDHVAHRTMYANNVKRSRTFMVAPGKWDVAQQSGGQSTIGYRYFEGAAAGAVLVGRPAMADAFTRLFDWKDAVVPWQVDGSDAARVVGDLLSDEARLVEIGRRNAREARARHDWSQRWQTVFETCGLPTPTRLQARLDALQAPEPAPEPRVDRL
jgi:hypothetical protein